MLMGTLQPVFRVPKVKKLPSPTPVRKLPTSVLRDILEEVVLLEGDPAILKLALVCSTFRDHVSSEHFRRRAHFKWLRSVCTWSRFSTLYREQYFVMYSIEVCRECGEMYKHCPRGFVGSGKRGQLRGFYSEDMPPGYCSHYCEQISSY
ncbi:hypothetical protein FQA47_001828 [Oryzias melastigma]|uniref:CxC7-like cysteine cluster associated with KDZ transposases domain-containing protein n=1 Tax=Oryzias melastigma TaxID=30732 RepID=A0A834FA74_ORYME|nr:hypothetical protein FQA47_001828 [Oryzias melastigma]